jgi:hypothetical protein
MQHLLAGPRLRVQRDSRIVIVIVIGLHVDDGSRKFHGPATALGAALKKRMTDRVVIAGS